MIKIEDRDFIDLIFQQFAQTTQAETAFWMPELIHRFTKEPHDEIWGIVSVDQQEEKTPIASDLAEVDADFITAVHGCFPDLVRRLHAALDEADRLDVERDEREQEIGRLSLENQELREEIANVEAKLIDERGYSAFIECDKSDLMAELAEANEACAQLEETLATARSKAADVLWKIERPM